MSKKIPFLEMFAALRQWTEFVNAMSGWKIVEAAIDRAARSAVVAVEGASGAGPNLIAQAEEAVAKCYGLSHVKLNCLADTPAQPEPPKPEHEPVSGPEQPAQTAPSAPAHEEIQTPQDAFARAEAIRAAALKQVRQAAPGQRKRPPEKGRSGTTERPSSASPSSAPRCPSGN